MPFLRSRPAEIRTPETEVLPDGRIRLTRFYAATHTGTIPAELDIAYGTIDAESSGAPGAWQGGRLINRKLIDQIPAPGTDSRPIVALVYEEIPATSEVQVGQAGVTIDQYGRTSVIFESLQFTAGTAVYLTVGATAAASPFSSCILKTEERTDDGTLRRIKRTYIDAGTLSDDEDLRFGGKVKIRTITSLNLVPTTPTGFTIVTHSTEYIRGLPVYRYGYASAAASAGGGGVISDETDYSQSNDQGTTGVTNRTIRQVSESSVSSNPISTPSGFTLIGVTYTDDSGYRLWTGRYAKGTGLVAVQLNPSASLGLLEVTNISLGTRIAPSGVIYRDDYRKSDGFDVFTVSAMQTSAGGSDPTAETWSVERLASFLYPGRAKAFEETVGSFNFIDVYQDPPITAKVTATLTITYVTSPVLGTISDLWNPTQWACIRAQWVGVGPQPANYVKPLPGYRSVNETPVSDTASGFAPSNLSIFGNTVYGAETATVTVTGGPDDPGGNTYTLDAYIDETPVFQSTAGVKYYRKVVISATIPSQAALPV